MIEFSPIKASRIIRRRKKILEGDILGFENIALAKVKRLEIYLQIAIGHYQIKMKWTVRLQKDFCTRLKSLNFIRRVEWKLNKREKWWNLQFRAVRVEQNSLMVHLSSGYSCRAKEREWHRDHLCTCFFCLQELSYSWIILIITMCLQLMFLPTFGETLLSSFKILIRVTVKSFSYPHILHLNCSWSSAFLSNLHKTLFIFLLALLYMIICFSIISLQLSRELSAFPVPNILPGPSQTVNIHGLMYNKICLEPKNRCWEIGEVN